MDEDNEVQKPLLKYDSDNDDLIHVASGSQEISKPSGKNAAYLEGKRSVTALQLTVMIYFFTSGTYC